MPTSAKRKRSRRSAPDRPRRRALRKSLWWLGGLAVFLLLIASPLVERPALGLLTRALGASLEMDVTAEKLDLRPWRADLRIRGIGLSGTDPPVLEIEADSLQVGLTPTFRLAVTIDRPRLTIGIAATDEEDTVGEDTEAQDEEPRSGRSIADWLDLLRLQRLEAADGELTLSVGDGDFAVSVDGLDAWLSRAGKRDFSAELEATSGALLLAKESILLGPLRAGLRLSGPEVVLDSLHLESQDSSLDARGTIVARNSVARNSVARNSVARNSVASTVVDTDSSLDLEAEFAISDRLLEPWTGDLPLRGEVRGEARFEVTREGLVVDAEIRSALLRWGDLEPVRASGGLSIDSGKAVLNASASAYDGKVQIEAESTIEEGESRLGVTWADLDLSALIADLTGVKLRLGSRSDGRAQVRADAFSLAELDGSAEMTLSGPTGRGASAGPGTPALEGTIGVSIDGRDLHLHSDDLRLADTALGFDGRIVDGQGLEASYDVRLGDLSKTAEVATRFGLSLPDLGLEGSLQVQGDVHGTLTAPAWSAHAEAAAIEVQGRSTRLSGDVQGSRKEARANSLQVSLGEGSATFRGGLVWGSGTLGWDLTATLDSIDLCALTGSPALSHCALIDGTATVQGDLSNPDGYYSGRIVPFRIGPEGAVVTGDLAVAIGKEGSVLRLETLEGELSGGRIAATATYDLNGGAIDAVLAATDISLADYAATIAGLGDLGARLTLEGSLAGSLERPQGEATISLSGLRLRDAELPDLAARLTASDAVIELDARLDPERSFLEGTMRLEPGYPAHVEIDLSQAPVRQLLAAFDDAASHFQNPRLAGGLVIDLSVTDPASLRYRAAIEEIGAQYRQTELRTRAFTVEGDLGAVRLTNLVLESTGTAITLDGRLALAEDEASDLSAVGTLDLRLLQTSDVDLAGVGRVDLHYTGTLKEPSLDGSIELIGVEGHWGRLDWNAVSAQATADGRQLTLEASGRVLDGEVTAHGAIGLRGGRAETVSGLEIEVRDLDLAGLLPPDDEDDRSVIVSATGTLNGSLLEPGTLRGRGSIELESAGSESRRISSAAPAPWRLQRKELTIEDLQLVGERSDLHLSAEAVLGSGPAEVSASISGALDLALVGELLIPSLEPSFAGTAMLDIELRVRGDQISCLGEGSLVDAGLLSRSPGFVLADGSADLHFLGKTMQLTDLTATLGGGELVGGGSLVLASLTTLESIHLDLEASRLNLELADGVRTRLSGEAGFHGEGDIYRLTGDLRVLDGHLSREIDAATAEQDFLTSVRSGLREADERSLLDEVELEIRLTTEGDLFVDNQLVLLTAGGNLVIGGTLREPELRGTMGSLAQGTLQLGRNTFDLERAQIELAGYPQEPPALDIIAITEVSGTTIRMQVSGTTDDLQTQLSSPDSPSLTQTDLASLLITGRTADTASEAARQVLQAQAATYLGELFAEQVGLGLIFDTPASLPVLSSETSTENRFSVGTTLHRNLNVSYSIAMDDAESQLWILDYQPARRVWFRALQEGGEAYTLEVAQRLDFEVRGPKSSNVESNATESLVGSVSVEGAPEALSEASAGLPKITRGDTWDYWRAQDDAHRIRDALLDEGYRNATVEVRTQPGDSSRTDVVFRVDPGHQIEIVWTGDDPGNELRRAVEKRWNGRVPEDFLLGDLADVATRELHSRRFFEARVEASAEDDGLLRRVTFDVHLGPQGRQVTLRFEGNHELDHDTLAAALPPVDNHQFFKLIVPEGRAQLERLVAGRYASIGHLEVRVARARVSLENGELTVVVAIREGTPYLVGELVFEGVELLSEAALREALGLRQGEVFSLDEYVAARGRVRRIYEEAGFRNTQVRSRARKLPSGVRIALEVNEGYRATVGTIRIAGRHHTRESVIRRILTFREGEPLRRAKLDESEKRLYELGVFRSVEIRVVSPELAENEKDIVVELVDRSDLVVDYGLRYRTEDVESLQPTISNVRTKGLEVVARTQLLTPFRRADSLGLAAFLTEEGARVRLKYRIPRFFGLSVPTDFILESETEELELFPIKNRRHAFTLQQRRSLGENLSLQWGYQIEEGNLDALADDLTLDDLRRLDSALLGQELGESFRRAHLTTSIVQDLRDHPLTPTRGRLASASVQLGSSILGSDFDFVRIYGQFSYFKAVGPAERGFVWASSYRAGAVFSSDFADISDRFTAGGPFSVRGFETNALGPIFGGQGVVVINEELRFPVYRRLRGGVFFDVGNVFETPKDIRLDDLRWTAGLGVRLEMPFGVFRLDYAKILDEKLGDRGQDLQFTFGHAF